MEITDIRIFVVHNDEKLKAFATITFDHCFAVRDLKVIQGKQGLFVAMPSKKAKDGTYKDVAHPINQEMRDTIEKSVIGAYKQTVGGAENVEP